MAGVDLLNERDHEWFRRDYIQAPRAFCSCKGIRVASDSILDVSTDMQLAYLSRCLELGAASESNGNHPFGALLLFPPLDSRFQCAECGSSSAIVLEVENTAIRPVPDATRHAEMNVLTAASALRLSSKQFAGSMLFSSTEPCSMCSGALYWIGIKRVLFACPASLLDVHAGPSIKCHSAEVFAGAVDAPRCVSARSLGTAESALLEDRASAQHQAFWPAFFARCAAEN